MKESEAVPYPILVGFDNSDNLKLLKEKMNPKFTRL